ncbi:MAG: glycosyltransferase family 4 protein [Acidobacteriota bacterium]
MRLGLITPGFSASEDDWCVPALLDLVRTLATRHDVEVFSLRYPHGSTPYEVYGARVFPIGGGQRGGLARFSILAKAWRAIRQRSRHRPFDVLHALWAHEPGALAAFAGRRLGVPVAVSILGGELADLPEIDYGGERSRMNRWLVARALAGSGGITVGSRWLRDQIASRVDVAEVCRLPLGVEVERFRRVPGAPATPELAGAPKLVHVASWSPVKDHASLFDAFSSILRHHPEARLHLIGEGTDGPAPASRLAERGLAQQVVAHGAIDHGELGGVLQQADLMIQSSRFESQGMAVLEAVAAGCPVVGTAVGVLPELSEGLEPALAWPAPADAAGLAEIASAILGDPARRQKLLAVQAEALADFALEPAAASWCELYRRLGRGGAAQAG